MKRRLPALFAALLLFSGCDHQQPASSNPSNRNGAAIPIARSTQRGPARAKLVALAPSKSLVPPPMTKVAATTPAVPKPVDPPPEATPPPAPTPPATTPDMTSAEPESTPPVEATPLPTSSVPTPADATTNVMAATPPITPAPVPPAPMSEAEAHRQVVVLDTTLGRIVIQLDDVAAPRTCGNFRKLVSDGFYNRTIFHRVIPHFMIQGGDPNSKSDERSTFGQGDPGYTLPAEIGLRHDLGSVAMARLPDGMNRDRESNGSQFFICVAPCPTLDGQYTVFGHVIAGLETATKIAAQPRDQHDDPVNRIEIHADLETKEQALGNAHAEQ